MSRRFSADFSFRSGAIRAAQFVYILAEMEKIADDAAHTAVLVWDQGNWSKRLLQWPAKSACVTQSPKTQLVAVGGDGRFLVFGSGDNIEGNIYGAAKRSDKVGPFRSVRNIAGKAYAVGLDGIVYRRDDVSAWTAIDSGLPADQDLEAIHGFSSEDIYAVGWNGSVWHFDGKTWSHRDTPTNVTLTGVCCAPDGMVYCCGRSGILMKGRDRTWQLVQHEATQADFWDVEWFSGKLFVSTMMLLYTLRDQNLAPVDFGDDAPATAYHLDAVEGEMISVGAKDVMAFDGVNWTRIE